MHGRKALDRFQLDDNAGFDKQIDAERIAKRQAVIFKRYRGLPGGAQAAPLKFFGKQRLINTLQQSRSECPMKFQCRIHNLAG